MQNPQARTTCGFCNKKRGEEKYEKEENNERIIDRIEFTPLSYDTFVKKKSGKILKKFEVEIEI